MIKNRLKIELNNEEGSGLVLALMVLLVLSVLGASLGVVTIGSLKLSDANRASNSAYYIAEAGANRAYEEFKQTVKETYDKPIGKDQGSYFNVFRNIKEKNYSDFDSQFGDIPTATVVIEPPMNDRGDKRDYIIKSTGEVGGKKRTVEKKVQVTWKIRSSVEDSIGIPNQAALIIKSNLELEKEGIEIIGDLYANKKEYGNASYNQYKNYIDGSVIEDHRDFKNVSKNVGEYLRKLNLMDTSKFPVFKLDSKENLTEEVYYQARKLEFDEKKGTINIGSNDVIIFAEKLSLDESTLDVIGTGSLTFVVSGAIEFKDKTVFNSSGKNVRIVSIGNKKIEVDESMVTAQFIAPFAKIEIDEGKVYGNIFADKVVIKDKGLLTYKSFDFNGFKSEDEDSDIDIEDLLSSEPTFESD